MQDAAGCKICALETAADADAILHRDEHWTGTTIQQAPGYVMMFTRQHDEGLAQISTEAAAKLGTLIQRVSEGLIRVGGFDAVSLLSLGDNSRHTHMMLVGRPPADELLVDPSPMLARMASVSNAAKSKAFASELRRHLQGDTK